MKKIVLVLTLCVVVISCGLNNKRNIMQKKNFKFYTDYHQFYLEDENNENKEATASADFWTDKTVKERLALANGIIGVGVQSYGNEIKGEIEILEKPVTEIDYNLYDHIVEAGIIIKSGQLQIYNCPDYDLALSIKLNPGTYRVRIYSSNLASVKETDLAHDTDNDYYRIEVWPSDDMERKVLKQYKNDL